jgi:hypothetical protein
MVDLRKMVHTYGKMLTEKLLQTDVEDQRVITENAYTLAVITVH